MKKHKRKMISVIDYLLLSVNTLLIGARAKKKKKKKEKKKILRLIDLTHTMRTGRPAWLA